jgi:putative redox protein
VWDVVAILNKQHQEIQGLKVTAESVRDDEPPWRFRKIRIHYRFSGQDLSRAKIQRAIDLSQTRYCATYATLKDAVELSSDFEIVSE